MSDPAESIDRASSPDADILRFDHPVREIPDQLAAFERAAVARWRESREEDEGESPEPRPEVDPTTRRLRIRRRSLIILAATGLLFLVMQLTGFLPGVFLIHMPLLVYAAVLVTGATAQRVPRGTPQFQNPLNWGIFATILFYVVGGSFLNLANLDLSRPDRWWTLYTAVGAVTLVVLLLALLQPGPLRKLRRQPSVPAVEAASRADWRPATLEACRKVLKQISRNAPADARGTGWLDLSGPERRSKLVRDDRRGRLYRDIWWRLRLPWEDGVRLRLAGIEEVRIPAGSRDRESAFQLLANLAVDPRRWRTQAGPFAPEAAPGLSVESFEVTPSRVSARLSPGGRAFRPDDLVNLIKVLEGRIQPAAQQPGVPGEIPAGGEA